MKQRVISQYEASELEMDKVLRKAYKMSPKQINIFHDLYPNVNDPNLASEIMDDLLEDRLERL